MSGSVVGLPTDSDRVGGGDRHRSPLAVVSSAQTLESRRYDSVTRAMVRMTLVAVGFDYTVGPGVTVGLVALIVFLPLWLLKLKEYSGAFFTVLLGLLLVPAGYLLADNSSADHLIDASIQSAVVMLILSGVAALVIVMWARTLLPLHEVVLWYATGLLAQELMFSDRSWKFDLALPVILVGVALAERTGKRILPIVVILALGGISVFNDGRSLFASCLLSAVLVMRQADDDSAETSEDESRDDERSEAAPRRRVSSWKPLVAMVVVSVAFYQLLTFTLTSGLLGSELQERSVAQIESAGSLIVGGRPEWSATRELVRLRPWGYGIGVQPSWSDLRAGREGFHSINVPESSYGYLERFMLGRAFELHSIAADLWAWTGVVGVVAAITLLTGMLRGMALLLARRQATVSVVFAGIIGCWYLIFGTPYSNWVQVMFAVGLTISAKDRFNDTSLRSAEPRR